MLSITAKNPYLDRAVVNNEEIKLQDNLANDIPCFYRCLTSSGSYYFNISHMFWRTSELAKGKVLKINAKGPEKSR